MSIASTTRKAGPFNGNGATTAFPFTFKVFQVSDVLVVLTDTTPTDYTLVLNTDYTVALNANQDSNPGGTVNMTVAPPTGYLLTIGSNVQQIQSVTLTNNGGFYPTVINTALDYVTVLVQQLSEKLGRALTLPFSTGAGVSTQLPPVSNGSLLGWKADGSGIANVGATGVGAGGIVASNMAAGATGTALSSDTQAAATKATPADADKIPLFDSAGFWSLKGLTWANLKAAFLTNGLSTIAGSQMQISGDLSPLYEGTQSTLLSGAAYTLNGSNLVMKAWTHNTKIDASGNFTGVGETGISTCLLWGEDDVLRGFTAPSVTAGTVPTFGTTPTYQLDLKTGAATDTGPVGATRNAKMVVAAAAATATFTADEVIVAGALGGIAAKLGSYSQAINLATVGAGGMDTGTAPANGFVALYASQTSAGVAGIFACNVATSSGSTYSGVNAPAGVVRTALIGIWPTNGSGVFVAGAIIDPFGRRFRYLSFPLIFGSHANIATYTLQSISGAVPPVARTAGFIAACATATADFSAGITGDSAGNMGKAFNVRGATAAGITTIGGSGGGLYAAQPLSDIPLLTAQTVYVEMMNSGGASTNYLYVSDYSW